jgi:hypothetical protein
MASNTASAEAHGAVNVLLREAKRLHHAATSESLATALPVLRRILATGTLAGLSLPHLHRRRDMVQRKHILRMLAIEAGFKSWEAYRPALALMTADKLPHFDIARAQAGYPNFWFSTLAEAQAHAAAHGGRAMAVGSQGVVLPDNARLDNAPMAEGQARTQA